MDDLYDDLIPLDLILEIEPMLKSEGYNAMPKFIKIDVILTRYDSGKRFGIVPTSDKSAAFEIVMLEPLQKDGYYSNYTEKQIANHFPYTFHCRSIDNPAKGIFGWQLKLSPNVKKHFGTIGEREIKDALMQVISRY